ncbi:MULTISPECIES: 1-phosphofructokinase [Thermoanaerobacterium]|uniref:Tagatose-6-phosphate kinase n=2 Tax=Thermoanaerobacterium TaxID=28895 RepID=W9EBF8_9THEO|nr:MULTISPECIES: 1-phosphofructokinase [Thermoanaerobacterium]AFK85378.1 1-phosphofructokinase [Thermoanaerobacterium saccharolyticum JW/SL-YS485]ETO39443.1 1-phosphofructokinase [Thermoanaerobacterium aotearoense SCUT27]
MVTTVTVNPAIDRTLIVNDFRLGAVNRVSRTIIDAGGKGINVAKNLKNLGCDVKCLGFMGPNGKYIENVLKESGIDCRFVQIKSDIRTNIKIVDEINHTYTDINEAGPDVSQSEIEKLISSINEHADLSDVIVLSGSLLPNMEEDFYRQIIEKVNEKGAKVILDADGDALKLGIEGKPYMIKPNIHELRRVSKKNLESVDEIIEEGVRIIESGISIVAVSMGGSGSMVVTKERAYKVRPIKVQVKGTVGAGDAYVAGFAYGLSENLPVEDTIKIASSASTSVIMREGTKACSLKDVEELKKKVEIEVIER